MSGAAVLVIIVVGVLLAGGVVAAAMRRRDTDDAIGHLSRETKSRDAKATRSHITGDADPRVAGQEAERRAVQTIVIHQLSTDSSTPEIRVAAHAGRALSFGPRQCCLVGLG